MSVFAGYHFAQFLPEPLQDYLVWEEEQEITGSESILFLLILPLFLMFFSSIVGLYFFKVWAKKIYIGSSLIMLFLTPFLGPTVEHAFVTALSSLESACFGFIFALLIFCDVVPSKSMPNKAIKNGPATVG
ncbi:hypothetical protein AAD001_17950 [Colwelliaceae bacterium 6471]